MPENLIPESLRGELQAVMRPLSSTSIPSYILSTEKHPLTSLVVQQGIKDCISRLAPLNCTVVGELLAHLNRVAAQHAVNKMTLGNLAVVWGPTLNFGSSLVLAALIIWAPLFSHQQQEPQDDTRTLSTQQASDILELYRD